MGVDPLDRIRELRADIIAMLSWGDGTPRKGFEQQLAFIKSCRFTADELESLKAMFLKQTQKAISNEIAARAETARRKARESSPY